MSDIIVIACGERCIDLAQSVREELSAEGKDFTLINARFIKPLDEEMLANVTQKYVVTLEDNALIGGLGSAISRFYLNSGKEIYNFGYCDSFIPHGGVSELAERFGLNRAEITAKIRDLYARG